MRAESGTEGDGDFSPAQGTFEGSLEVTMAGEAQSPALGVAKAQSLDGGWQIPLWSLASHATDDLGAWWSLSEVPLAAVSRGAAGR